MRQAKKGDTVKVHYTGMLDDGTVFDTSRRRGPLELMLGSGTVIPAFEEALVGMSVGETKELELPPTEAYGPHREELVIQLGKNEFPPNIAPQEGMELNLKGPEDEVIRAVIAEVSESSVTIDANHPLAGKDITFLIQMAEIA